MGKRLCWIGNEVQPPTKRARCRRPVYSRNPQRTLLSPCQCHTAESGGEASPCYKKLSSGIRLRARALISPLAAWIASVGYVMWLLEFSVPCNPASNGDSLLSPGFRRLTLNTSDWGHTSKDSVLRHFSSIFLYAAKENTTNLSGRYFGNR